MPKPEYPTPTRRPRRPTNAEPGSAAKIAVMRDRVSRGEEIEHPDDRRLPLLPLRADALAGCSDALVLFLEAAFQMDVAGSGRIGA